MVRKLYIRIIFVWDMETETLKQKIERWVLLTEQLFEEGKSIYIKDVSGNYFMGDIILIGDDKITVDCFSPKQREGKREQIRWVSIVKCVEYKEVVGL